MVTGLAGNKGPVTKKLLIAAVGEESGQLRAHEDTRKAEDVQDASEGENWGVDGGERNMLRRLPFIVDRPLPGGGRRQNRQRLISQRASGHISRPNPGRAHSGDQASSSAAGLERAERACKAQRRPYIDLTSSASLLCCDNSSLVRSIYRPSLPSAPARHVR